MVNAITHDYKNIKQIFLFVILFNFLCATLLTRINLHHVKALAFFPVFCFLVIIPIIFFIITTYIFKNNITNVKFFHGINIAFNFFYVVYLLVNQDNSLTYLPFHIKLF